MGDSGSGFLGMVLGLFSIQSAWLAPKLIWGWLILLGAFMVDASVTLLRRMARREKVYQAHRSHAYQQASRKIASHWQVSLAFGVINLLWLLPLAVLVVTGWLQGIVALAIAYAPLIWLALRFRAGLPE
jgi:Fuc2NAc and GlcNAc transferase